MFAPDQALRFAAAKNTPPVQDVYQQLHAFCIVWVRFSPAFLDVALAFMRVFCALVASTGPPLLLLPRRWMQAMLRRGWEKVRKIRGKIKNVGAPTFSGGYTPLFSRMQGKERTYEGDFRMQGKQRSWKQRLFDFSQLKRR
jgi:hypothetical protein